VAEGTSRGVLVVAGFVVEVAMDVDCGRTVGPFAGVEVDLAEPEVVSFRCEDVLVVGDLSGAVDATEPSLAWLGLLAVGDLTVLPEEATLAVDGEVVTRGLALTADAGDCPDSEAFLGVVLGGPESFTSFFDFEVSFLPSSCTSALPSFLGVALCACKVSFAISSLAPLASELPPTPNSFTPLTRSLPLSLSVSIFPADWPSRRPEVPFEEG
jgi:hypothetical protein